MGLKSRSKVNAEFNMSSLTDIIFLLLIFFMLTSSLVQIRVDLPESDAKTVAPSTATVSIEADGTITLNGKKTSRGRLQSEIETALAKNESNEKATITIATEKNQDWGKVKDIMKIANNLQVRAMIATKPTE